MEPIKPTYLDYIEQLYKLNKPSQIVKNIIKNVRARGFKISSREKEELRRYVSGDTSRYPHKS